MPTPKEIASEFFGSFFQWHDDNDHRGPFTWTIENLCYKGIPYDFALRELTLFADYWTEPTASGKKQRWETEKTFELDRRIRRWFMNKKFPQSLTQLPGINL